MGIMLATLSSAGWSNSLPKTLDNLLTYAFLTDVEQSQIVPAISIVSMPAIIQRNLGDIPGLIDDATRSLETYFRNTFDEVVINVTAREIDNKPERVNLVINIGIQHGVNTAKLVKSFSTYKGKLQEFIIINNTGEQVG